MSHRLLFTLALFLTVANLLVWGFLGAQRAYANRVYPGIWVETQPLAGLTEAQVVEKLKPIHDQLVDQKISLSLNDKQYQPTLAQLGYSVDTEKMAKAALQLGRGPNPQKVLLAIFDYSKTKTFPLTYTIDQGKFDSYLNDIGKEITKDPKNMALSYQGGNLIVTPGESGTTLNKDEIRQAIQQQVKPGQTASIQLSVGKSDPVIANQSQVDAAKTRLTQLLTKPLSLQAEEVTASWTPDTIYSFVYFDVKDNQLTAEIDQNKVRAALAQLAKSVDHQPSAKKINESDQATLEEGSDGRQLDVPDALSRINDRLTKADFDAAVVLKVDKLDRKTVVISPEYTLGLFPGRYIVVDLSSQRMHLIEGDQYHKTFIVSTGKWDKPTPIGTFAIQNHVPVAFSKTYKLYMPNWMAITPDGGYGIHQLPYWPGGKVEGTNHLGTPVSHGCVRLGPGDADYVYAWAANGTPVVIHQ